jgi:hypothetical protein
VPSFDSSSGAFCDAAARKVTTTHWAPAGEAGAVQLRLPAVVPSKNPSVFVPVSCEVRFSCEERSISRTPVAGHGEAVQR